MRSFAVAALAAAAGLGRAGAVVTVPANALLGTCLNEAWVESVETTLGISASARDSNGGKPNPFLHAALQQPRFWIEDWRTDQDIDTLYQAECMEDGDQFFGVDSTMDSSGEIDNPGRANGSLVIELHPYSSLRSATMMFAILAQELLGYEVSYLSVSTKTRSAERMSSRGYGRCAPSHMILEVRADDETDDFVPFANETYSSASIGYYGRGGMYTTAKFIEDGQDSSVYNAIFSADFWRDYRDSEELINSLPVSDLTGDADYYPPSTPGCADGVLGCQDSCTWTAACADRIANSQECLLVVMPTSSSDPGYLPAVLSNLNIPAYLCYLGAAGAEDYITARVQANAPVVFYYYEPELLTLKLDEKLTRVALPAGMPSLAAENTGTFGEDGPGTATSNPVAVDFPYVELDKFSSTLLQNSHPVESLLNRISLSALNIEELMRRHVAYLTQPNPPPRPSFTAACDWLKVPTNYPIWSRWLAPLPDCTVRDNVNYALEGCTNNETDSHRTIRFYWRMPDPRDTSQPYDCDGALTSLPTSIQTSRTCEWLEVHYSTWIDWTSVKPTCTDDYYSYRVTECNSADSLRTVEFYWFLPDANDSTMSSECVDGVELPETVYIECEYVMHESEAFKTILAMATILLCFLVLCAAYVTYYRNVPIIKRSQYQFLLSMIAGGMLMGVTIIVYAGPPRTDSCAVRPIMLSYAFTLIFGSLIVKSLRVYRVFMKSAMKRVVLSAMTMFKILFILLLIDSVLLAVWFTTDPAVAAAVAKDVTTSSGVVTVDAKVCTSSSFIFSALIIFWKAILLFSGLYLSFLIRKVSSDFQESTWIFASSLVVLFTSIIMLGLAYLVVLPPTTFYLFFAFMLLSATTIVMSLMLVPKLLRHRENASDKTSGESSSNNESDGTKLKDVIPSDRSSRGPPSGSSKKAISFVTRQLVKIAPPTSVQVTPVQQFSINPAASYQSASSKRHKSTTEAK